eukprot:185292_1
MALLWTLIIIVSFISTAICLLIFCTICYYLFIWSRPSSIRLHKPVKYYSVMSIFWFTICNISAGIGTLYCDQTNIRLPDPDVSPSKYDTAIAMTIMNLLSWSFGVFCLYLLFITRLKRTYRDSTFAISSRMYFVLYGLNVILLVSQVMEYSMLIATYYDYINLDTYSQWSIRLMIGAACVHLIISSTLVYSFLSRLMKLLVMMALGDMNSAHFSISDQDNVLHGDVLLVNSKQQAMLNVMTRHCILSITAIMSTLIYFATTIVLSGAFADSTTAKHDINYYTHSVTVNAVIYHVDCVVNCVCIWLAFKFHTKLYLCCCGKCDRLCQLLCLKCFRWKVKQKSKSLLLNEPHNAVNMK